MKSYVVVSPGKGQVELQQCEVPNPGAREIQVRVHASLISPGTERATILNLSNTPGTYPFEPGYCAAGVVEQAGSEVTRFKIGDRVACFLLAHRQFGNVGEDTSAKIPDDVPFENAVFLALGQIAMQGVRKAQIGLGEGVMVLGLGVIGQLALQFAKLNGALPLIGADRVEKRLQLALQCGADNVVNAGSENWIEQLGEKPQVVIESTGYPDAIGPALQAARDFGRVILLGSTRGDSTVNFYRDVHRKALDVIGAHAFFSVPKKDSCPGYWTWRDDAECFMKLLEKSRLCLEPLITEVVEWKKVEETYKQILAWNSEMIGTVIRWQ